MVKRGTCWLGKHTKLALIPATDFCLLSTRGQNGRSHRPSNQRRYVLRHLKMCILVQCSHTPALQRTLTSATTKRRPPGSCWTISYVCIAQNACSNLILYQTQSDRADKLAVTKTGSGDLSELREQLDDTKASFAYVRVKYANDVQSQREKFILVVS